MTDNSSSPPKIYVLRSSDNETFEVEEAVAVQSVTLKNIIDDDCADAEIPLPNVMSNVLAMVIEYCKRHVDPDADLKAFDEEFVNVDHMGMLFDLILAANYLNIKNLLDLACQKVADMIKGESVEEVRKIFNVKNDFTPEEEAEVRKEHAWAFEK